MQRFDTEAEIRENLNWKDDTVFVFEIGNRQKKVGAFFYSTVLYLLAVPVLLYAFLRLFALLTNKGAFWLAGFMGVGAGIALFWAYLERLLPRRNSFSSSARASVALMLATMVAVMVSTPGPIRDGLMVAGEGGFFSWVWFFIVQAVDLALTGFPRALGLSAHEVTPTTWPARIMLGLLNLCLAISVLEMALSIWRVHFSSFVVRDTVQGAYLEAAQTRSATMEEDEEGEELCIDVIWRGRVRSLGDKEVLKLDGKAANLDVDDSFVYRWEVCRDGSGFGGWLLFGAIACALPIAAFLAASLPGRFRPEETAIGICVALAVLFAWRLVAISRTLAGTLVTRSSGSLGSAQVATLVSLGLVTYLFIAPSFISEGLIVPEDASILTYAHFVAYHVMSAILLDVPDGLGIHGPDMQVTSAAAGAALSALKFLAALGLVEALVMMIRTLRGHDFGYARTSEVAGGLARLSKRAQKRLVVARTHVDEYWEEPVIFDSGLFARAWENKAQEDYSLATGW